MGKSYRTKGGAVMIEKVNPCHPDKIADRIAGAVLKNLRNGDFFENDRNMRLVKNARYVKE